MYFLCLLSLFDIAILQWIYHDIPFTNIINKTNYFDHFPCWCSRRTDPLDLRLLGIAMAKHQQVTALSRLQLQQQLAVQTATIPHPPLDADVDASRGTGRNGDCGRGRDSNKSLINRRLLLSALLLRRCFSSAFAVLSAAVCRAFCVRCVGVIRYDTVFPQRFSYYRSFAKSSCRERNLYIWLAFYGRSVKFSGKNDIP